MAAFRHFSAIALRFARKSRGSVAGAPFPLTASIFPPHIKARAKESTRIATADAARRQRRDDDDFTSVPDTPQKCRIGAERDMYRSFTRAHV